MGLESSESLGGIDENSVLSDEGLLICPLSKSSVSTSNSNVNLHIATSVCM